MKKHKIMEKETVKCPKCGGLMGFEQFRGGTTEVIPWSYEGWRCLYCGMVVDSIILDNRMKHREGGEPEEGVAGGRRRERNEQ